MECNNCFANEQLVEKLKAQLNKCYSAVDQFHREAYKQDSVLFEALARQCLDAMGRNDELLSQKGESDEQKRSHH